MINTDHLSLVTSNEFPVTDEEKFKELLRGFPKSIEVHTSKEVGTGITLYSIDGECDLEWFPPVNCEDCTECMACKGNKDSVTEGDATKCRLENGYSNIGAFFEALKELIPTGRAAFFQQIRYEHDSGMEAYVDFVATGIVVCRSMEALEEELCDRYQVDT